jgi:hypothetical protein
MLVDAGHTVSWSDWDDCRAPASCDLLIGHPHPSPGHSYELAAPTAIRSIAICPWNGTPADTARLEELRERGLWHHLLAICGPEWARQLPKHWPVTPLDMAADPDVWSPVEIPPSPRVLYVGCTLPSKGTAYLAAISEASSLEFHHVGPGQVGGRVNELGLASNGSWRGIAQLFPRIISTGVNDANPTTILEGALMGMLPFGTSGSGWGDDLVVRIPDDDPVAAARVLEETPVACGSRRAVAEGYSWERFAATVMGVVEAMTA